LEQQIAALQRSERDLLKDNEQLAREIASSELEFDAQERAWEEEVREKEMAMQTELDELARQTREQADQMRWFASLPVFSTVRDTDWLSLIKALFEEDSAYQGRFQPLTA